jgi:signal transduction histidine kinase
MEKLSANLLELAPCGVCRYTLREGRILAANRGLMTILGLDGGPASLIGLCLKDVLHAPEAELRLLHPPPDAGESRGEEVLLKTPGGGERWVVLRTAAARDGDAAEPVADAIIEDVTTWRQALDLARREHAELQRAKEELERDEVALREYHEHLENLVAARTADLTFANAQLTREIAERAAVEENLRAALRKVEEQDQAKSDFVSNVAHELKTPVTTVGNCIENLLAGVVGPVSERVRSYLQMMEEDCQRLAATIGDILDLSRIDAGKMALSPVRLPFARFVRRAAESLRVQAEAKGLCLTVDARDGLGFVECDPPKMERVVLNIVQNAVNFTPEAGEVEVALERNGADPAKLVLSVTDNGAGIPAEFLDRIAERYFRVDEHVRGTGLGLSLCREIVRLHGGTLKMESPPPGRTRGTRVSLLLASCAAPRVLAVDDDPQVLGLLRRLLEHAGYAVTATDNGAEGYDLLLAGKADLLILDLIMPGLSGFDLIGRIKANRALSSLPLVVVTGADMDPTRLDLLNSLRIPVVAKPWDAARLMDCVELTLIGKYRGRL